MRGRERAAWNPTHNQQARGSRGDSLKARTDEEPEAPPSEWTSERTAHLCLVLLSHCTFQSLKSS